MLLLYTFEEKALLLCRPFVIEQDDVEMVHNAILFRQIGQPGKADDTVITLFCNDFDLVGNIRFTLITECNDIWLFDGLNIFSFT